LNDAREPARREIKQPLASDGLHPRGSLHVVSPEPDAGRDDYTAPPDHFEIGPLLVAARADLPIDIRRWLGAESLNLNPSSKSTATISLQCFRQSSGGYSQARLANHSLRVLPPAHDSALHDPRVPNQIFNPTDQIL
jgi:hypothetical protein